MDPTSTLFLSVLAVAIATPNQEAKKSIFNAYMKQSGIEQSLSKYGEHLERQQVSSEARVYLGYMFYISKTAIDKRIVFQWSF